MLHTTTTTAAVPDLSHAMVDLCKAVLPVAFNPGTRHIAERSTS
jgi:hypothetical protein